MEKEKKPRPPMNPEIYRELANRPDFNTECRAARAIFRVLGVSTADRKMITTYCLRHGIIEKPLGSEPEVAVFTLKTIMRYLRPSAAAMRVQDYVLTSAEPEWYSVGVYPEWTGAVTAMISPDSFKRIVYAVHADDIVSVEAPFSVTSCSRDRGGNKVFQVQQPLASFVGEITEDVRDELERTLLIS
jgi:hypothetical protein